MSFSTFGDDTAGEIAAGGIEDTGQVVETTQAAVGDVAEQVAQAIDADIGDFAAEGDNRDTEDVAALKNTLNNVPF